MATTSKSSTSKAEVAGVTLQETAMLVDLDIGTWEGHKKNKKVTEDVVHEAKAEKDAGSWWDHAVSRVTLRKMWAAVTLGRLVHDKFALPWEPKGGARLLPNEMFETYTKEMRAAQAQFQSAVDDIVEHRDDLVKEAKKRCGENYYDGLIPSPRELQSKFRWRVHIKPVTDTGDFRVKMSNANRKMVLDSMSADETDQKGSLMTDLWQRLHERVAKVAERLSDPENTFKDSLIENLIGLCDLLPKLNVLGDPKLEQMRQEVVTKLASQKPQELRDDEKTRQQTHKDAEEILKKMQGFFGAKV